MDKKYELRKQVKSVRWIIFWVVLAQFAAEVSIEAAVSFMANPPHRYLQIAIVELLAIGVPIIIYAKTVWNGRRRSVKNEFGLNGCSARHLVLAGALGVSGQFVMMLLNVPANYLVSTFFEGQAVDSIPIATQWYEVLLGLFAVVLVPAVLEEFWMRGIIFRAYSRCNTKAAVIFTGFIFAMLHFRLSELAGFLFMGITASIIMLKSGSLYAAMIYHALSNLTALLFGAYIMPAIIDYIWYVFAAATLIFVLAFVVLLRSKSEIKQNRTFRSAPLILTSIFSLPVILSVIVVSVKFFVFD